MMQKPNISAQDTIQFLQEGFNQDATELTLLSGGDWSQAYSFVHPLRRILPPAC
jgi:hypothetical protein